MQKRKFAFVFFVAIMSIGFFLNTIQVSAASTVLKQGMQSSSVTSLQKDLKTLGFFSVNPTGYFGNITLRAVKEFQGQYGIEQDGIVGKITFAQIDKLLGRSDAAVMKASISRGGDDRNTYLVPWFGGAENIFDRGDTATVYDINTGLSFNVKRTYGYNHSDTETLTAADTAIMKKIYGGEWSWSRRAIIVTVDGRKLAASMAGMPHAGVESQPANIYVNWRSEGYGAGINLDTVKGNGMSGHFDIHFLKSRTHGTNRVDENHQLMVQKAADWAARNY